MEHDNDRIPTDYSQEKQQDPSEFDGHIFISATYSEEEVLEARRLTSERN